MTYTFEIPTAVEMMNPPAMNLSAVEIPANNSLRNLMIAATILAILIGIGAALHHWQKKSEKIQKNIYSK